MARDWTRATSRGFLLVALTVAALALVGTAAGAPAATTADATALAQETTPEENSLENLDGESYWQGETLAIDGFEPGETVTFDQPDGDDFLQTTADPDGRVVVVTSTWNAGDWTVSGDRSSASGEFTIREHTISTFTASPSAAIDGTTLIVDSNRVGYDLSLGSDSISAAEFDAAFESGTVRDDGYVLPGDGEYEVDVTELALQNHTIVAEVPDSTASVSTTLDAYEQPHAAATLGFDVQTEDVGDVVTIPVDTQGTRGDVWLLIQEESEQFEAHVQATVEDGSEPLRIEWNTHHGLDPDRNYGLSAENGEIADVEASGDAIGAADHWPDADWTFSLESYTSQANAAEGEFSDVALVEVESRQTEELNTWTAPGVPAHSHDDDLDDVLADATERSTVANGDLLIAEVQASGVYGYLAESPADFQTEGLDLALTGTETPFGDAPVVNATELDGAATITARPDDDAFYVVVDTGQIPAFDGQEQWDVQFSVDGANNPYVEDDAEEVASDVFTHEERVIELTGRYAPDGRLVLPAEETAEVTAETNVAPGTSVNLRANLPQDFRTASGQIADDGTFSESIDLSGYEAPTRLNRVRVRAPDRNTQHEVEGVTAVADGPTYIAAGDAPTEVAVGDDGALEVAIDNIGAEDGTANVSVAVDGEVVGQHAVDIGTGERWTETYDLDTGEEGVVDWSVSTDHGDDDGAVRVFESLGFDDYGPRPYSGSDLYYDVDGDGSMSQSDVVVFFERQHRESWKQPSMFDFDDSGSVSHGDVFELFEIVATNALDNPFVDLGSDGDDGSTGGSFSSTTS